MPKKESEEMKRLTAELQTASKEELPSYQLAILVERANRAKHNGPEVKELRKFLDEHPDLATRHHVVAYTVLHAVRLKVIKEPGNLELFEREYEKRRDDLGWKDASAIERLMIERIMLSWVRLLWCEHYNGSFMQPSVSMRESEYADKQYTRAHARYVKAIESLAKLRQVQAVTKAADAQASILDMKEKTIRARIEGNTPKVFDAAKGLRAAREQLEQKRA
jgi:hypothetical protein